MLIRPMAAGVLAVLTLGGCGGGSSVVVRSGTGSPTSATVTTPAETSTRPSTPAPSPGARHPALTVTPATGLADRQVVRVQGTGFSPGEALQVVQCADKGLKTGPGDCNLTQMLGVSSDASGRVTSELEVVRGPFGGNNVVCSAAQPCLVSVTQASLTPTEEADARIEFRAGS